MNYELVVALGGVSGIVVLAFLYARAVSKAKDAEGYKLLAEWQKKRLEAAQAAVTSREDYIRGLEKTVVGQLSPGELANRLNSMFTVAASRRETSAVPAPVPTSLPAGASFRRMRPKSVP